MTAASTHADDLKVFAAASLTDALGKALAVCSDVPATGIYAGSGTLARQIEQGAPADIYISANPQWMDWLEARDRIVADTRIDLLGNSLVMIHSTKFGLHNPLDGDDAPFAIADPASVPAGRYARQALEAGGNWPPRGRLIYASNVREVLTWVARGEVKWGVVYGSDAHDGKVLEGEPETGLPIAATLEFPASDHDPIRYPAAVVADNDAPKARRLLACLQGEEALDVFERFGFTILPR